MNTHEVKHYKIQRNGKLKLVKVTRRYNTEPCPMHSVVTSCFPRNLGDANPKKMDLYPMRTVVTCRMRTGSNPERGDLQWCFSSVGWYWLNNGDVKKLGIVNAYRKRVNEYYAGLRERKVSIHPQKPYED